MAGGDTNRQGKRMKRFIILVALVTVFGMTGLPAHGATDATDKDKNRDTFRQLELFGTVFDRVRSDYVEDVDVEKLIENAVNGRGSTGRPLRRSSKYSRGFPFLGGAMIPMGSPASSR